MPVKFPWLELLSYHSGRVLGSNYLLCQLHGGDMLQKWGAKEAHL